ncbi:poly-beta-1,6-N-acetyl-D-glucosamine N-deacetylase PgaB [Pectobacterium carotovorum subsp. carotovorum]|nr:poly-beta-1,6-N-acetyl-D-glucosamine N-deacetylase PgaB [Pectobacterium carotovorum subsp. carotovorum]
MSFIRLRNFVMTLGVLILTACAHSVDVKYSSPAERPILIKEQPWKANQYIVIAYHDVADEGVDQRFMAVRTRALNEHFVWLRENGYHPVSVDDILAAGSGGKPLPDRAVLLTFDDGYSSFYHRVYPLLKAYGWPAVLAPVGRWLDTPEDQPVDFSGVQVLRNHFLTWQQVGEMAQSGLVEIGAHTYDLHKGIQANPQGNREPAAVTRHYFPESKRYETRDEYRQRFAHDTDLITKRIVDATGKKPRVWVWPYGAISGDALSIVKQRGYQMALTLGSGPASADSPYNVPRILINNNPDVQQFALLVSYAREPEVIRVAHIDLDYVYDTDKVQQSRNVDALVQRVADLRINTVYLQAFSDPKGDGNVQSLYFPNRWMPVREDLFNHVAWQLASRALVRVYAWMPVLAFDMDDETLQRVERIDSESGQRSINHSQYRRLSLWDAEARGRITDIYEDLSSYAMFSGILFHDDAVLADDEDASHQAIQAYQEAGFPGTIDDIRRDPQLTARWTRFKSKALTDFTLDLAARVHEIRGPQVQTARNIFALPAIEPESEAWFSQNLDDFLAAYDWVAPMAMPLMENVASRDSDVWLQKLVQEVARRPGALNKTVFELQARDWRVPGEPWLDTAQLVKWMTVLQLNGAQNYGYYPDDFLNNSPELESIRPMISSEWYPLP